MDAESALSDNHPRKQEAQAKVSKTCVRQAEWNLQLVSSGGTTQVSTQKRSVINYLLIILSLEKVVQHVIVSLSLLYDIGGIRSTVAVDYRALLVSGAVLAVLFVFALWALVQKKSWGLYLVAILAASDIIGEFIAQGTVLVAINVSIIVAIILMLLCYLELRNLSGVSMRTREFTTYRNALFLSAQWVFVLQNSPMDSP